MVGQRLGRLQNGLYRPRRFPHHGKLPAATNRWLRMEEQIHQPHGPLSGNSCNGNGIPRGLAITRIVVMTTGAHTVHASANHGHDSEPPPEVADRAVAEELNDRPGKMLGYRNRARRCWSSSTTRSGRNQRIERIDWKAIDNEGVVAITRIRPLFRAYRVVTAARIHKTDKIKQHYTGYTTTLLPMSVTFDSRMHRA